MLAAAFASSCDVGSRADDPKQGPRLHVIAAYPAPGEGENCAADAGPDCGVPVDAPIELRFDRFLRPDTAVRQSIRVCPGPTSNDCVLLRPFYDVVERVVSLRLAPGSPGVAQGGSGGVGGTAGAAGNGGGAGLGTAGSGVGGSGGSTSGPAASGNGQAAPHWLADTVYLVELVTPGDAGDFGFRAFDGALIEASSAVPLQYSFKTGSAVSNAPALEPPPPSLTDIQKLLDDPVTHKPCGACHDVDSRVSPRGTPMGFAVNDLANSGVDKVAHETAIAGRPEPLEAPSRFGAQMRLVAPGEPSNSYLLYKLLLDPDNYAAFDCSQDRHFAHDCTGGSSNPPPWCAQPSDCTDAAQCSARIACLVDPKGTCYRAPLPDGATIAPSSDELRRLRNWFGAGDPMPLPYADDAGIEYRHLGKVELRMIQSWIAHARDCR